MPDNRPGLATRPRRDFQMVIATTWEGTVGIARGHRILRESDRSYCQHLRRFDLYAA